jgi:hypothetical protein
MIHGFIAPRAKRELRARRRSAMSAMLAGAILLAHPGAVSSPTLAQGGWNPFAEQPPPGPPPRRQRPQAEAERSSLSPMDGVRPGSGQPQSNAAPRPGNAAEGSSMSYDTPAGAFAPQEKAESSDLPPIHSGSGGQRIAEEGDTTALLRLAADLEPTRSPALARLLVRLLGPGGLVDGSSPAAIGARSMALYRAGRVGDADAVASGAAVTTSDGAQGAALAALRARLALTVGDRQRACSEAQALIQTGGELPASLKAEGIVIQGWCGAAAGNPAAAGLAAALGREQGGVSPALLAVLEAVAAGDPPVLGGADGGRITAIEWRLAEVVGKLEPGAVPAERLDAATMVAVATSGRAPTRSRLAAAEAAARINALEPAQLADVYRQLPFSAGDIAQVQTPGARVEAWSRRALLFRAAEAERTPFKRTRLVRAALDDARRAGLYWATAAALARAVDEVRPVAEVGWFAETAVEIMLAAGQHDSARRWAQLGTEASVTNDRAAQSLAHWLALIDIADPAQRIGRGASLASVEDIALRGRYTPEGLHRLATVLDALDYHVPMRLWEAASRSPQPTSGHLPPTGLLSELQDAAKRKDMLRTVTLAIRALGPEGPEGAHMIALGDVIRALKRAGLEPEARAVAAEALLGLWPRTSSS